MRAAQGGITVTVTRRTTITLHTGLLLALALVLLLSGWPSPAEAQGRAPDLGREVLGTRDGWAAAEGGTTGGVAADDEHVFTVGTWQELREALGGDDARGATTPRIVYVEGTLDANTDADGNRLACEDYADPEYSLDAYLEAYDPATWGIEDPSGPLEDARERSYENQAAQVRQHVGSNTTIVGVGDDARIVGASLRIRDADNVIVRNLELSDAYDCFPQWAPSDAGGTWNSEFDNISVWTSTHVWVDHVTLNDGEHPPSALPEHFGARFEVHDGLLDITHGSDLVTVSYNEFVDHDKTMLIGSTNAPTYDVGKLRVTIHHNRFEQVGQRVPRVRYGQVHIYNNHYIVPAEDFQYSWGVGFESRIFAEHNYFNLKRGVDAADVIYDWDGTVIHEEHSVVNGRRVDLLDAYNAEHDPDLGDDVGWVPELHTRIDHVQSVPWLVALKAGAGKLGRHGRG